MESTQNKIYEIEESAIIDQTLKNVGIVDDDLQEENKNDYDLYNDQFDENLRQKDGNSLGDPGSLQSQIPKNGITVEISMGGQSSGQGGNSSQQQKTQSSNGQQIGGTGVADSYIPIKTGTTTQITRIPPYHIKDAVDFEPLYPPQEFILEESLRREAERVAHQENLMNRVVYDCIDPSPYHNSTNANLIESTPEGEFPQFYVPSSSEDYTLVFESRFESGNLRRAIQVYEFEYDLILKPDYNTRGYTQWYYFRVSNTKAGKTYRFNIINLMKPDSLYNHGMRPVAYSEYEAKKNGRGWYRGGGDICYYQNSMKRKNAGYYYTLTFSIQFEHDNDTVYLAHCYPYTYTDLTRYLNQLESDPKRKNRMRRRTLCQTIAGNNCEMIIVTTFQSDPEAIKNRKGVVISSRVHPGESGASWMMKGVIDYLTGPSLNAKILRDNFVFKIVPMLNPDGVINGSSRCNLAGVDLNRCWIDPSRKIHPTIYHTKMMIKKLQEDRDIFLFCDFHGHSRKKNVFMYGNSGRVNDRLKEKIFPCLLDKNADIFNFGDCNFAVQKQKESTARVVMWKELGITNSFTLEASFCGADQGKFADYHFNTDLLQEVGHRFCDTILDFCDPDQVKVKAVLEELEIILPKASESESDEESDNDSEASAGGDDGNTADKGAKKKKVTAPSGGQQKAGAGGQASSGQTGAGKKGNSGAGQGNTSKPKKE